MKWMVSRKSRKRWCELHKTEMLRAEPPTVSPPSNGTQLALIVPLERKRKRKAIEQLVKP